MILRKECAGKQYKWVEKGSRAAIIVGETKAIWWGSVGDFIDPAIVPLEVMMFFSAERIRVDRLK